MSRATGFAIVLFALAAAGCSDHSGSLLSAGTPVVLESFEVGPGVVVRSLAVEPARRGLWVGTSTGVLEVDLATTRVRRTFTRKDGLANEYVFAIGIDDRGDKWFGTNAGGISRLRGNEWKTLFPMHGLADYWVYAFAQQGRFLWIGTWAGASKLDLDSLSFTNYVEELVNEWVYGVALDANNRMWFGTEGGVSMLEGTTWRHWTHADGLGAANKKNLPASQNTGLGTRSRHDLSTLAEGSESYNPNYVFSVHVAQDGAVWAGTWGGGVARFDGGKWHNLTAEDGLAGNIVYSIAQDPGGAFWFGTNHGLSRYDGRHWTNYTSESGLSGDDVYALAVTQSGDVWAGTRDGVTHLGAKPRDPMEKAQ
jgi:ligand-binding sensor domain-containing protein